MSAPIHQLSSGTARSPGVDNLLSLGNTSSDAEESWTQLAGQGLPQLLADPECAIGICQAPS